MLPELNLTLQLIIFTFVLIGIYYIKGGKRSLKRHRIFMGLAVALNAVLILSIMGRSFLNLSSLLLEKYYESGPFITWMHAVTGGLAQILGILFFAKHPRRIHLLMRLTAAMWITALFFGIIFYLYYYL